MEAVGTQAAEVLLVVVQVVAVEIETLAVADLLDPHDLTALYREPFACGGLKHDLGDHVQIRSCRRHRVSLSTAALPPATACRPERSVGSR